MTQRFLSWYSNGHIFGQRRRWNSSPINWRRAATHEKLTGDSCGSWWGSSCAKWKAVGRRWNLPLYQIFWRRFATPLTRGQFNVRNWGAGSLSYLCRPLFPLTSKDRCRNPWYCGLISKICERHSGLMSMPWARRRCSIAAISQCLALQTSTNSTSQVNLTFPIKYGSLCSFCDAKYERQQEIQTYLETRPVVQLLVDKAKVEISLLWDSCLSFYMSIRQPILGYSCCWTNGIARCMNHERKSGRGDASSTMLAAVNLGIQFDRCTCSRDFVLHK